MNSITPVILSGGSGTRLWPLSREAHPKQFLPIIGAHSLLQATALRLRGRNARRHPHRRTGQKPGTEFRHARHCNLSPRSAPHHRIGPCGVPDRSLAWYTTFGNPKFVHRREGRAAPIAIIFYGLSVVRRNGAGQLAERPGPATVNAQRSAR